MNVAFLAFAKSPESLPKPSLPEIAFVGRSNAGKSSLINTLLGKKLAHTSLRPGRTQGLCFFKVGSHKIFVDFPGFGYARVSKQTKEVWGELVNTYYQQRPTLKGTLWVYDVRRDPDALDHQMHTWLQTSAKPFLLVLTKTDKLPRVEWILRKKKIVEDLQLSLEHVLLFSSKTKEGLNALRRHIE